MEPRRPHLIHGGQWSVAELATLEGEGEWRDWIRLRLEGRDPWVDYWPDEWPDEAAGIFMDIYDLVRREQTAEEATRILENLRGAVSSLLKELSPRTDDYWLIRNAANLAAYVRARDGADALRQWIDQIQATIKERKDAGSQDEELEPLVALLRIVLDALASLQKRSAHDSNKNTPLWKHWMDVERIHEETGLSESTCYTFVPVAFRGLALCSMEVPKEELVQLLDAYEQAKEQGVALFPAPAVLALFEGDRPRCANHVEKELARAVSKDKAKAETRWETLKQWLAGTGHSLREELPPTEPQSSDGTDVSDQTQERLGIWNGWTAPAPTAA